MPEVVEDGHTGILVDEVSGLTAAVQRVDEIDRRSCRAQVESRFSTTQVVAAYEQAFDVLLTQALARD